MIDNTKQRDPAESENAINNEFATNEFWTPDGTIMDALAARSDNYNDNITPLAHSKLDWRLTLAPNRCLHIIISLFTS